MKGNFEIAQAIAASKGNVAREEQEQDLSVTAADREGQEGYVSFSDIIGRKTKINKFFRKYDESEWDEKVRGLIPTSDPLIQVDEEFAYAICLAIEGDMSLLAYGPPGTGKTVTPREICARLGYPFLYIQGMGGTEPADYVGSPWLSQGTMEWRDAVASFAVRHGTFLLFDEPFKVPAQTNMCFQSLLDDRKELKLYGHPDPIAATLKAHPRFRMALCDNVRGVGDNLGKYATEIQDQSTMDRVDIVVKVDYAAQKVEADILARKFPDISGDIITKVVRVANLIRKSWASDDVSLPFTMRKSQNWLAHIKETGNIALSFKLAYLNGCTSDEEYKAVKKAYEVVKFGADNNL